MKNLKLVVLNLLAPLILLAIDCRAQAQGTQIEKGTTSGEVAQLLGEPSLREQSTDLVTHHFTDIWYFWSSQQDQINGVVFSHPQKIFVVTFDEKNVVQNTQEKSLPQSVDQYEPADCKFVKLLSGSLNSLPGKAQNCLLLNPANRMRGDSFTACPPSPEFPGKFEKFQHGMSEEEVSTMLGAPRRTSGETWTYWHPKKEVFQGREFVRPDGELYDVFFDKNKRVTGKQRSFRSLDRPITNYSWLDCKIIGGKPGPVTTPIPGFTETKICIPPDLSANDRSELTIACTGLANAGP